MFEKLSKKYKVPNPLLDNKESVSPKITELPSKSANTPDFAVLLSDFYKIHNPGRISDVNKTLEKYRVSVSPASNVCPHYICIH